MKNTWKKLLAMTLAASMLTGMLGVGAWAEGDGTGEEKQIAYCGKNEHTHSIEKCYRQVEEKDVVAGDPSYILSGDTHYYKLTCTMPEHTHTDGCYNVHMCTCTTVCGVDGNKNCPVCRVNPDACLGESIYTLTNSAIYKGTSFEKKAKDTIEDYDSLGITMPSLVDGWAQIDSTDFVDGKVTLLFYIRVHGTSGAPYCVTSDATWVGGAPMKGYLPDNGPGEGVAFVEMFVAKMFSKSDIVTNDYGDWLGSQASVEAHQTNEDASGEWDWVRVNTKVTLTYDANAGDDEVTGLPKGDTVNKGSQVTVKDYRNMKRDGYKILGWSLDKDATWPDTINLRGGLQYTLNENTTFYAVWSKNQEETEIPAGAKLQQIMIMPGFYVSQGDGTSVALNENLKPKIGYEYSYTYGGKTYTGETKVDLKELIPGTGIMGGSGNLVMDVLVDETGATPTMIDLTLKGYVVEGYNWYAQMGYDCTSAWTTSRERAISLSVNANTSKIWANQYYQKAEAAPAVANREAKVVVSFETLDHKAVTLDKVSENYAVTYSYVDEEGKTVTKTLERKDAEVTEKPRTIIELQDGKYVVLGQDAENPYYYFEWTIEVPVIGEGSYLTLAQSNYGITEKPYVWSDVAGVQKVGPDGDSIGEWYISKGNNPVYTYIYNMYAKEFTVTYTDGVENSEIFADQVKSAKEGAATPAFEGTPSRSGYTFNGWSPAVADTVTGDVTYVAQWSYIDDDDDDPTPVRPTPSPEPTSTPEPVVTPEPTPTETPVIEDLGENDTPLAELPAETEQPATEPPKEEFEDLEDEDVPLAQVPETGDSLGTWLMMSAGALFGLAWLGKKKEEA